MGVGSGGQFPAPPPFFHNGDQRELNRSIPCTALITGLILICFGFD
jgi:hypothetical protein